MEAEKGSDAARSDELVRSRGAVVRAGHVCGLLAEGHAWPGHACGLVEEEYAQFDRVVRNAHTLNGWFVEEEVRHALGGLSEMLAADRVDRWLQAYPTLAEGPAVSRLVGVVMAGNVPFVGFHDLLCVLLSGHRARVKCSAQDAGLTPALLRMAVAFLPELTERVAIVQDKLGRVDALIATGSDNTARYFHHYFADVPRIVRRNRVSVALLDGTETDAELAALGEDIFRYFGLGCRNVSKIFVPHDLDLDRFFKAIYPWNAIIHHAKYANNYDYHRALWLLEGQAFLENGFLLLKEEKALTSPVGSVYYERYRDAKEVEETLVALTASVQCRVGHGHVPFGRAQYPGPESYADGVDTLAFLKGLQGA
ncbi:MAG: acyl-CoA reductase [Flavobacteriales bacterium]|nr:acyl-CoA reductase [Flavobacteriales bacterium]MCB9168266.1 acyl-CoA reductase [Flavobacteriales bacterium]